MLTSFRNGKFPHDLPPSEMSICRAGCPLGYYFRPVSGPSITHPGGRRAYLGSEVGKRRLSVYGPPPFFLLSVGGSQLLYSILRFTVMGPFSGETCGFGCVVSSYPHNSFVKQCNLRIVKSKVTCGDILRKPVHGILSS